MFLKVKTAVEINSQIPCRFNPFNSATIKRSRTLYLHGPVRTSTAQTCILHDVAHFTATDQQHKREFRKKYSCQGSTTRACNIEVLKMSSSEEEIIILAMLCEEEEEEKEAKKKRRFWVHPINQKRKQYGEFHHLFPELKRFEEKFFQYFRMSQIKFDYFFLLSTPILHLFFLGLYI